MIKRGACYFLILFGVGFVLGMIRVPLLVPLLGERTAELVEAPFMLAAIYLASAYLVKKYPAAASLEYLLSGLVALGLLVAAEVAVVLLIRDNTMGEYIDGRDPVAGAVYLLLLLIFSLMPWWVSRKSER
jgi:hypothetical protein